MREGLLGSPRPEEEFRRELAAEGSGGSRFGFWSVASLVLAILIGSFYSFTDKPVQSFHSNDSEVHEWNNIQGSTSCIIVNFYRPTTENEIVEIVKRSVRMRQKVRVVGKGTSWAPVVCAEDRGINMISLDNYNDIIYVDQPTQVVTVQPGITLRELQEALFLYHLAIPVRPALMDMSVGGALSTAAHGTGSDSRILAHYLTEFSIIDAKGRALRASKTENSDVFYAAGVGVGVMGVLSTVSLKCVPLQNVQVSVTPLPGVESVLSSLDASLSASDEFSFYWVPSTDAAVSISKTSTNDAVTSSTVDNLLTSLKARVMTFCLGVQAYVPRFIGSAFGDFMPLPSLEPTVFQFENIPDYHHPGMPSASVQFFVPQASALQAFRHLKATLLRELNNPYPSVTLNGFVSVYFVKGDQFYMSPTYDRDSVAFELTLYGQTVVATRFLNLLSESLKSYEARPHWSSHFGTNAFGQDYLRRVYPKFSQFQSVRSRMDPEGTFMTRYTSAVLKDSVEYLNKKDRDLENEEKTKRMEAERLERLEAEKAQEELEKSRADLNKRRDLNRRTAQNAAEEKEKSEKSKIEMMEEQSKQASRHVEEDEKAEQRKLEQEQERKRTAEEGRKEEADKKRSSASQQRNEQRDKKRTTQDEQQEKRQIATEEGQKMGEARAKDNARKMASEETDKLIERAAEEAEKEETRRLAAQREASLKAEEATKNANNQASTGSTRRGGTKSRNGQQTATPPSPPPKEAVPAKPIGARKPDRGRGPRAQRGRPSVVNRDDGAAAAEAEAQPPAPPTPPPTPPTPPTPSGRQAPSSDIGASDRKSARQLREEKRKKQVREENQKNNPTIHTRNSDAANKEKDQDSNQPTRRKKKESTTKRVPGSGKANTDASPPSPPPPSPPKPTPPKPTPPPPADPVNEQKEKAAQRVSQAKNRNKREQRRKAKR